ncbi:MAG TPA: hypothetical protein VNM92_17130 [Thermoanaerobaculia bacterium]|nr:hypothetical protein [Thermoanaerobaculia bacterium]
MRQDLALSSGPRRRLFQAVFVALSLAGVALAAEVAVRIGGTQDIDGNFFFRGRHVPPYRIAVSKVQTILHEYGSDSGSYMVFDAHLGWSNRPRSCSRDRLYCANSEGLRANRDYPLEPESGGHRVALFGDSFIHGHDVPIQESMAPQVEESLSALGSRADVLNYGVGGYGIDQAFLRYLKEGRSRRFAVVIVGLQLENVARAVNVFRIIYHPGTAVPFSKPRFVLKDKKLVLMNDPTVPVGQIVARLAKFGADPLRHIESFYDHNYTRRWFHVSKLLAIVLDRLQQRNNTQHLQDRLYRSGSEATNLTLLTLKEFQKAVEANGSRFFLVYLPTRDRVEARMHGRSDSTEELYREICHRFPVIDPLEDLLGAAKRWGIQDVVPGHYSGRGNRIVAAVIAKRLKEVLPGSNLKTYRPLRTGMPRW